MNTLVDLADIINNADINSDEDWPNIQPLDNNKEMHTYNKDENDVPPLDKEISDGDELADNKKSKNWTVDADLVFVQTI